MKKDKEWLDFCEKRELEKEVTKEKILKDKTKTNKKK